MEGGSGPCTGENQTETGTSILLTFTAYDLHYSLSWHLGFHF